MEAPLTPLDFARRTRKLYPEREAVVDGALRLTYEGFFSRCDRWSGALQRLGVMRGDRVAYISPNTHRHLESFYAVPQIGAVLVPINFRLTANDFEYIINHCGAVAVCVHSDQLDAVDTIRTKLPHVRHFVALEGARDGWLDYEQLLTAEGGSFEPAPIDERGLLTINYTSGTTSRPKGVMITHRNAYINIVGTLIHVPMTCADRYLWTLPMFHANGWTFTWIVTAVGGAHICLRKIDPAVIFDLVDREAVTMLCAAPTVLITVARRPRGSQAAFTDARSCPHRGSAAGRGHDPARGGRPGLAPDPVVRAHRNIPLYHCLRGPAGPRTDVVGRAVQDQGPSGSRADHVGRAAVVIDGTPIGNIETEVPRDGRTLGEIIVRGNVVMEGYYNDPEATATAFAGGWFHSGDGAVVHPDGYVEIRDRFKDVIISGGENISSVEVEGVLLQHSAVVEAAVVGVPDAKWGEVPQAFVVLRPGIEVTEEELREFVRSRLAHFKAPRDFTFVSELPKTATGKIQKYVLRQGRSAITPS